MKKLNKKLILEFLDEDNVKEIPIKELDIEKPIEEPIIIDTTNEDIPNVKLSEGEKKNFIMSLLTEISSRALDLFNYLTPILTLEVEDNNSPFNNLSEENKDLLRSIYEDVSLIVGKATQGLKDNTEERVQNAIDDGQTEAQEITVSKEINLEESLDEDRKKDLEELKNVIFANMDMGDWYDDLMNNEEEIIDELEKNTEEALNRWKEYYSENEEVLNKIKVFEDKYLKKE